MTLSGLSSIICRSPCALFPNVLQVVPVTRWYIADVSLIYTACCIIYLLGWQEACTKEADCKCKYELPCTICGLPFAHLEPLYGFFTGLLGRGFFRGADATTLSLTKLCPAN